MSAFCHSNGLIIGQTKTEEKSNEITAIPVLLEQLMIKGCIVTIDAKGAQRKIAEQIVEKNKADYVINLKGNQEKLHEAVQQHFAQAEQEEQPIPMYSTLEKKAWSRGKAHLFLHNASGSACRS